MGYGDQLMATGMARGAAARGKRIAFGDGMRVIWDHLSASMFKGNPNIAHPGSAGFSDIEWIPFYQGHRIYNVHDHAGDRWIWNKQFKARPGEIFLTQEEQSWAKQFGKGHIVIEKEVNLVKLGVINKQWDKDRYDKVAKHLTQAGHRIVSLEGKAPTFRHAVAALSNAALYIGPEGGLHHGAAAVGIPSVVIFGSWIPPQVTGYKTHANLTGGADFFCGNFQPCKHCKASLDNIKVEEVINAAEQHLKVMAC